MSGPRTSYDPVIGERAGSSWNLRGWLLFDAFGIPVRTHSARLYSDELPQKLRGCPPPRTVPTAGMSEGTVAMGSLARRTSPAATPGAVADRARAPGQPPGH